MNILSENKEGSKGRSWN